MSELHNTVLIVDDDLLSLKLLSSYLKNKYRILIATSGSDAIRILNRTWVDLVIVDITLPDSDGVTLYKQAETIAMNQSISVIFISANDQHDSGLAHDFLLKPIDSQVLVDKVATYFNR